MVVLLTPPGRGAIATLLVEGPGAAGAVEAVFRARGAEPLSSLTPDRLVFGHVGGRRTDLQSVPPVDGLEIRPTAGEEVVLRRRSPQSIELHCHGGLAAVAMLQRLLAERGCRPIAWQDWAAQTLETPIQSAAMAALAEARTARTAAILLDQYHGALGRAIESIRQSLSRGDIQRTRDETGRLLGRADLGRHLTRPWQVVLTGPPNTGKSSLLNALVGYTRAIVDPAAGTTRDVVTATTALDGWPVEFSDTAGIRVTDIPLEQAGIGLAEERVANADLVVHVLDASQGSGARVQGSADEGRHAEGHDPRSGRACPPFHTRPESRAPLVVYNKSDLMSRRDPSDRPGLLTSALHSEGIGVAGAGDLPAARPESSLSRGCYSVHVPPS